MQHPDEGTIHSWLDGVLPADEAAGLESHVAACQSCAAAVAEARGFIAASSRILTALDDVPRGVLPAAPARKRDLRVFWRAAAAMLVVAGGSLVVMREGGQNARVATSTKERAVVTTASPSPAENAGMAASAGPSVTQADERASSQPPAPPMARERKAAAAAEKDMSGPAELRRVREPVGGVTGGRIAADAITPTAIAMEVPANTAPPESEITPLKVLRVERRIGSRRTTYEIAPSETVTLTEPESMRLSEVVVTGAQTGPQRQSTASGARAAQPMRLEAAPAAPPPPVDSRTGADSTTGSKEAASTAKTSTAQARSAAAFAAAANTISWTETTTGKTLTLSGNLPIERLQEIRRRIEKERAAAGKKVP